MCFFTMLPNHPPQKDFTENAAAVTVSVLRSTKFDNPQNLVFEQVHRICPYNSTAKSPRPIGAKMLSYKDTERVLQHNKLLVKGEGKPFITPQFTTMLREKRKTLGSLASDLKKNSSKEVKTKLVKDRLYVNGQHHPEPLAVTSPMEILHMTPQECREIEDQAPTLHHGDSICLYLRKRP